VIGSWVAAAVVSIGVIVALLGGALTSEGEMTNNPESYRGDDLVAERLPPNPDEESYGDEIVLVRSRMLTAEDPAFRRKVEEVARAVEATGAARRVRTFYDSGDRPLVSRSRRAAIVFVEMGPRNAMKEGLLGWQPLGVS
jgi:hypothetical protein